jgi:asparagine synthase (glutamine-hydrolysing)
MPGICAIISPFPAPARLASVRAMVDVMRHIPGQHHGTLQFASAGLAAGWVVHAHQQGAGYGNPYWNESRDIALILCGEVFARTAELADLRSRGHAFTDHGDPADASHLVHRYEELGPGFVDDLDGIFSGVLIDLRQQTVVLFNDRFGLGRVYVHEAADGSLWIASEAKAILSQQPSTRQLDPQGLADTLACGCALQGRSLFKDIRLLPPAARWIFSHGRLMSRDSYFRLQALEALPPLSEADHAERLSAVFPSIVRRYTCGSARIGMSLTGGLDGRMIMACQRQLPVELSCYTFGSSLRDCHDVTLARQVAAQCGRPHQVIVVNVAFLADFERLAQQAVYLSDGAMDVSGAVELFANEHAREIAPVRLTGNYGSEILRSNVAFKAAPLDDTLFSHALVQAGEVACDSYRREAGGHRLSFILGRQMPWHHPARLALEQSQLTLRSPYLDHELVHLAYQAPAGQATSPNSALNFIARMHAPLAAITTDRGLQHRAHRLAAPLARLQHLTREFSFRAEYAWDYGMPQWLAPIDQILKPLRPDKLFLGRHKFYHFRVWYRDRLAASLKDVLLDRRSLAREHLIPGAVPRLVNEHLSGRRNHTTALHQLLSIELMQRQLIERDWRAEQPVHTLETA